MQARRGGLAPWLRAAAVLLAALLAAPGLARACEGSGPGAAHGAARWDRQLLVKGRQRSLLSMQGRRCGAEPPAPAVLQRVELALAARQAKEAAFMSNQAPGAPRVYVIPTYVYNIVTGDNRGFVSDEGLRAQVDALNAAYATAVLPDGTMSNSGDAAGVSWKFDVQQIAHIKAGDMCDSANEKAVKAANRKGGKGALNLYITDLSSCGLLGYSTWPWELDPKAGKPDALTMDAVVIHHETLPGGSYKPYDRGVTAIHETGHWMGLFHVFQNGCSKGGDQVDDTPFQAAPTEGCPTQRDSCPQPGTDPFWNYMDYTDDKCMKGFTPLQHKRMETLRQLHRQ